MPELPGASFAPPGDAAIDWRRIRELDLIVRTFGEVVAVIDDERRVIACDGAIERVWGVPPGDLAGELLPTVAGRVALIDADGVAIAPSEVPSARALREWRTQIVPIIGVRLPGGAVRWAHVVAVPLAAGPGGGRRVMTVWTDLTPVVEHDPAEDRVRERTAALETTVTELEAFSYTVSHDLRAPARTITSMVDVLLDEAAGMLGDDQRVLLERIRDTATRMDALTTVLLQLAGAARGEVRRAAVDLSAIARDELEHLRRVYPERTVQTRVTDGLIADADEQLMRTVLHNLLGNAWKFTAGEPHALIEFGLRASSGARVFFVRDNGSGFDMSAVDRIFLPFERLDRDVEGTGVGLATVRRAITGHGGRVWAESAPGRGATFYFTLGPAAACPRVADAPTPG